MKQAACPSATARPALAWNLPDPVPVHREPIYTPRRDLVAKYPTLPDARQYRMPNIGIRRAEGRDGKDVSKDFPIILTSGRLVEYEGGGEETRSNKWLAELQQDMFVEINPADAAPRHQGRRMGLGAWEAETKAREVKALVTERVGRGVALPFHFGGWFQGEDQRSKYPPGTDPIVLGESANTVTTYGYDPVTDAGNQGHALPDPRGVRRTTMARMKFLCDADRCIECNACVTACKNEHEVPWGINRRRVVTINDGKPGERSISMACMHCTDAPCAAVCPVDASTRPRTAWCCTPRTCASAAATASTPARSARRSIRASAISARAARWTSAPTAPAGPRPTARRSSISRT